MRTVVDVHLDDCVVRIAPAPIGTYDQWPESLSPPVHFVTGWDPGHERPGEEINRARQGALEIELRTLGSRYWRSIGFDLHSGHREEGVALCGLSETTVLEVARRYGQQAIFTWTPDAWATVSCVDDRREAAGWRLVPPSS